MSEAAYARIAKIFPMLSSDQPGEVANAARAMANILKQEKLHWTDVAKRIVDGAPPWEGKDDRPFGNKKADDAWAQGKRQERSERAGFDNRRKPSAWAQDATDVKKVVPYRGQLDDWSQEFVESIEDQVVHQGRRLSERQRDKLNEIMDKLGL
jgi:hypothetical protein